MVERYSDSDISQHGKSIENAFSFMLPSIERDSSASFFDHPDGNYQSFIVLPGANGRWMFKGGSPSLTMAFDLVTMKRLVGQKELVKLLEKGRNIKRNNLSAKKLTVISEKYRQIINMHNAQLIEPNVLAQQLDWVASELLMLISAIDILKPNVSYDSVIFVKAIDFIKAHFHRTISMGQIADHANTSLRNLQYQFKRQVDLSPQQFLLCYRLYQFHKILPMSPTVEYAGLKCGFQHMGRLSSHYKRTYGVTPSQHLNSPQTANFHSWLQQHPSKYFVR